MTTEYAGRMKQWYNGTLKNLSVETVVGNYDYHENFPYESQLLFFNGDIRRPIFDTFEDKIAFDIACGEGRMIRRMSKFFERVDGADFANAMVAAAGERCPASNIYLTNGANCGDAVSRTYDFAYCTISLQHIADYPTRRLIISDLSRILKPDGKITLQLLFSEEFPYVLTASTRAVEDDKLVLRMPKNPQKHVGWFESRPDAAGSNGACDSVIGTNELAAVKRDFLSLFRTCDFWFHDVSLGRREPNRALPLTHPSSHGDEHHWQTHMIFVHCTGPRT